MFRALAHPHLSNVLGAFTRSSFEKAGPLIAPPHFLYQEKRQKIYLICNRAHLIKCPTE